MTWVLLESSEATNFPISRKEKVKSMNGIGVRNDVPDPDCGG